MSQQITPRGRLASRSLRPVVVRPPAAGSARRLLFLCLALGLVSSHALTAAGQAPDETEAPYLWQELAPGVWAAAQPETLHFQDSNSLIVAGERATLVVDAQSDPEKVEWLVERTAKAVEAVGGGTVRYLVHTHWHGDHTQGSIAWSRACPGLAMIGHRSLWVDVPGRTAPALTEQVARMRTAIAAAEEQLATGKAESGETMSAEEKADLAARLERARQRADRLGALKIPTPDIGVSDRLELDLGTLPGGDASGSEEAGSEGTGSAEADRVLLLLHLPGHTDGDLVVWLPHHRVLASGDLFDALPYGGHGHPAAAIANLEELAKLPFDTLVPGHGPILRGEAARTHLDRITRWFRFVFAEATAAAARGDDADAALATVQAKPEWQEWRDELTSWPATESSVERFGRNFDAFAPATFTRALEEARSEGSSPGGETVSPH